MWFYDHKVALSIRLSARQLVVAVIVVAALVGGVVTALPVVGAQTASGDADCNESLTGNDSLVILEARVGLRGVRVTCPLVSARTELNIALADFNEDGAVTVVDALLLAKCCGNVAGSRFTTLPPTSPLPSGAACAQQVRPTRETIPENAQWNARVGVSVDGTTYLSDRINGTEYEARIDGNFVGTTDEIIQWAACKWGIDEDHVRAQALIESSWFAGKLGDCDSNTIETTQGCASVGLLQIRGADVTPVHPGTLPWAWESTAFNLDYALAVHRACFEGAETWLAGESPNGLSYRAGDLMGCSGRWFSGDWYSDSAINYIAGLETALSQRRWRADANGCVDWETNFFCR